MMNLQKLKRLGILCPPLPWDKVRINESNSQEVVVVLHGLWRSMRAMEPMAKYLFDRGYTTINVPYASFQYDLDSLVDMVMNQIRPWIGKGKTIHFVTHSLGGVVVKRLLELLADQDLHMVGRVVMLAPPHKGSEVVDWMRSSPLGLLKGLLGPAGEFLSTAKMAEQSDHFPEGVDAAIIMGDKSTIPFFRRLLESSNDGIVSVEKGNLLGVKEFKVVDADHTFISCEDNVMNLVAHFIDSGSMKTVST